MKILGLVMFAALVLFAPSCGSRSGLTTPTPAPTPPCCGDRNSETARVVFSTTLAANSGEVPVEMRGCGVNSDQITAIRLSGNLAGCPGGITFSPLVVEFTTTSCLGPPTVLPGRFLVFNNVRYTGELRTDLSPACVSRSSVEFEMRQGGDPGFTSLFQNRDHEQTLLPILDRFVLGWVASNPSVVCPIGLTFGGVRGISSRCAR